MRYNTFEGAHYHLRRSQAVIEMSEADESEFQQASMSFFLPKTKILLDALLRCRCRRSEDIVHIHANEAHLVL